MQILLAFDSFKESLSSLEAARCFQEGFEKVFPDAQIKTVPLSDGGEGFVEALVFQQGSLQYCPVTRPLGSLVNASYGWIPEKKEAVVEMAAASGLELVPLHLRNPLLTTSYGTGELIKAAIEQGARHFFIGIGGSATVDGGTGMAQALGVQFFDKDGSLMENKMAGKDLSRIARISTKSLFSASKKIQFTIACDVDNPWIGPQGAARIFSPQKGATAEMIEQLEAGMLNLAEVIQHDLGQDISDLPGAGAAGGLGGMFSALFKAELKSGISIVMDHVGFKHLAQHADLIVTGEGRIDSQTVRGKTMVGVAKLAKRYQVPLLAIGGCIVQDDLPLLHKAHITATMPLVCTPLALADSIRQGGHLMRQTGERVARLMLCLPKPD